MLLPFLFSETLRRHVSLQRQSLPALQKIKIRSPKPILLTYKIGFVKIFLNKTNCCLLRLQAGN
jgi:hypothetical protein